MAKKARRNPWQQRQANDPYVKKAQDAGYRSRATFKLIEVQEKDKLIKPGMNVVDLGAAPGGWSQMAAKWVGQRGRVIALDILPMDAIAGVDILQGDFTDETTLQALRDLIGDNQVDVVICDMAPNMSGIRAVDQPKAMYLAELTLEFAREFLRPGGDLLVKVFQGEGIDEFRREMREIFPRMLTRKPQSSRSESRETYLLGRERNAL